jgi:stage V sporulation protein B
LNLVLQVDGLLFSAIASRQGIPEAEVTTLVGMYKVVQSFAFLPYQLLLAVTFVVFPVVSRSTLDGDKDATRLFVAGAMRFSAMVLGAMIAVLAGVPRGVLQLAFRPPFDDGAQALRFLAVGQGGFTLLVLGTTIVIAAARTRAASTLMLFTLVCVVIGDVLGVTLSHTPQGALNGLALGTASGWLLGVLAVGWYVQKEFGAFVSMATIARVTLCTTLAAFAGNFSPFHGKIGTLISAGLAALVYVFVLGLSGELKREELSRGMRLLRRKK